MNTNEQNETNVPTETTSPRRTSCKIAKVNLTEATKYSTIAKVRAAINMFRRAVFTHQELVAASCTIKRDADKYYASAGPNLVKNTALEISVFNAEKNVREYTLFHTLPDIARKQYIDITRLNVAEIQTMLTEEIISNSRAYLNVMLKKHAETCDFAFNIEAEAMNEALKTAATVAPVEIASETPEAVAETPEAVAETPKKAKKAKKAKLAEIAEAV